MNDSEKIPKPNTFWQNLKTSNVYWVIGFAKHSETQETLVLYMREDLKVWARSLPLWYERFNQVEESAG